MIEILMVRHGQSVWNAEGRWQGQADPPLSPLGHEQAAAAAEYVKTMEPFDGVVSSTQDRAATTAAIIAEANGFPPPFKTADLTERHAGEWSGLTREDIDRDYPGYLKKGKYPPGYEYDDELLPRIRRGLLETMENVPGNRLLIVAHGGLIYCIEGALGRPFQHMSNLGARYFEFDPDGTFRLGHRIDLLANYSGEHTTPTAI